MTFYVEHDMSTITSGDLSTNDPDTDELAGGWVGSATAFDYDASPSAGVAGSSSSTYGTMVQTDGREDVQVTLHGIWHNYDYTNPTNEAVGMLLRGTSASVSSHLRLVAITHTNYIPVYSLKLYDHTSLLYTFDISSGYGTWSPSYSEECTVVVKCEGDDITLVSKYHDATLYEINETYTLTGGTATAHGAGSGADYYGILSGWNCSSNWWNYFAVESIGAAPAGPHAGQRAISVV